MVTRLALTETFLKERRKEIMDYKVDCRKKKKLLGALRRFVR